MRTFRAFFLPVEEPARTATVPLEPGTAGEDGGSDASLIRADLDRNEVERLLRALADAADTLASRSNRELVRSLGSAGARFLDPGDPLRKEAEEWLPLEAGLSGPMARRVIERMAEDWTRDSLSRLLREEFADPGVLEGFRPGPSPDHVRAAGPPLAFHLGAGNVSGVGAGSILRSLLVRSPVLLKPGRGDVVLPVLLARAVAEESPDVGRALAVSYWPGGSRPALEEEVLERAGIVVAYGGMEVMDELRRRMPSTTPLVEYRHRVSLGAVGRSRLRDGAAARKVARDAAEAVSAYDQRGCVSPHVIWVEKGGAVTPEAWSQLLAAALDKLTSPLPPGPPSPRVAARIQQIRSTAELQGAGGKGVRLMASRGLEWTVIYEPRPRLEAGCTGRVVRVQAVGALEEVPALLSRMAPWLQSVAVEAAEDRRETLALELARRGVSRVTVFHRQAWPRPWWTHDGQGPLRALVSWTTLEGPATTVPAAPNAR